MRTTVGPREELNPKVRGNRRIRKIPILAPHFVFHSIGPLHVKRVNFRRRYALKSASRRNFSGEYRFPTLRDQSAVFPEMKRLPGSTYSKNSEIAFIEEQILRIRASEACQQRAGRVLLRTMPGKALNERHETSFTLACKYPLTARYRLHRDSCRSAPRSARAESCLGWQADARSRLE